MEFDPQNLLYHLTKVEKKYSLTLLSCFINFENLRGKEGYMVLNLDLRKAYDKVEWDFTLDTLSKVGIPPWMANAIHVHMSSTFMAINWNGIPFDSFTPMCGRR